MAKRVPASERTSEQIEDLLAAGVSGEKDVRSELIRLGMKKILEEALEAEVEARLGRGYYGREGEERGYRNGYRHSKLKSAEGAIEYAVPQVSDLGEAYRSRIREMIGGRSEMLEELATEMFARGLSTRNIEALFSDEDGKSLLPRTAVSEITEKLWEEYEAFATRDLGEHKLLYLYVDGVAERLRPGQRREAVLCAWGIDEEGNKVLIHLSPGTKEDTESCRGFFEDLKRRGLSDPLLVVTDGAPGLIRAVEECFPRSYRQRCLAHRMRNLQSKVPETKWSEVRVKARACYEAPSLAIADVLRDDFVQSFERELPSAVKCFLDDFEACTAHLRFPIDHRKVIRTTNLLERLFLEERRRTKIIPNAFGERPMLKLMYAAVIRASDRWRGIKVSSFEKRQCDAIRDELDRRHQQENGAMKPSTLETKGAKRPKRAG